MLDLSKTYAAAGHNARLIRSTLRISSLVVVTCFFLWDGKESGTETPSVVCYH